MTYWKTNTAARPMTSPRRVVLVATATAMILAIFMATASAQYLRRADRTAGPKVPAGYQVVSPYGARGYVVQSGDGRLFYYDKMSQSLTFLDPQYSIGRQIDEIEDANRIIRD